MGTDDGFSRVQGFDALYGLEVLAVAEDSVRAQVVVRDELRQPFGLVHGGVLASIAETLASLGTAVVVVAQGSGAMGLSNSTSFLRPITDGTIHARATRRHRGRTTWIWDVEISDDAGRLCALTRMTIAVRPLPSGGGSADPPGVAGGSADSPGGSADPPGVAGGSADSPGGSADPPGVAGG